MKHLYTLLLLCFFSCGISAQNFCDPNGNVAIYSNYDGGPLTINVDQNIPNLKIGILSYEFCRITITGTYASNVTAVWWIGYNGTNDHCSLGAPLYTTISGVSDPVDSIILIPPATYSNPNGYSYMICNYTCNTTQSQGGCNTADQVAAWFLTNFGGSLYFHYTQYGCWQSTMNISTGGNCCANPLTGENEIQPALFTLSPNPAIDNVRIELPVNSNGKTAQIRNTLGEVVREIQIAAGIRTQDISLDGLSPGTYFFRVQDGDTITIEKLIVAG